MRRLFSFVLSSLVCSTKCVVTATLVGARVGTYIGAHLVAFDRARVGVCDNQIAQWKQ